MQTNNYKQNGAVSLFVVIFTTLLVMIITVSFVKLMLNDQQQATASDLSQSAYDSAQAGVEDAKRLLLLDQACRANQAPTSVNCGAVTTAISASECNTLARVFGNPNDKETLVEQRAGDEALQQAYTCVKILADTEDYKGESEANQSSIVPLRGIGAFNSIEISWFTRDDIIGLPNTMAIGFPSTAGDVSLPPAGTQWGPNNPSLVRAQFMQTGGNFTLNEFNDSAAGGRSNANTLFLYPSSTGASNLNYALDARRSGSNVPQQVRCVNTFATAEYACTATISVPAPIDGNLTNRNAFLRLSALYNGMHYKVRLLNNGTVVAFDRVQPEVDSTGRANDLFRRVVSRVELKSDFIYPEAAVDIEGDLCKNFTVTDTDADYTNNATQCNP